MLWRSMEKNSCIQMPLYWQSGHSARDTFETLYRHSVPMEAKAFAVGLRIQHPQTMINMSQYGMEGVQRVRACQL